MLELENSRWSSLTHAYGAAQDVPELIRQLQSATQPKESYKSEPWFSLWSCLCHQDEVFDASYAALPHIVEIACAAKSPLEVSFFQLPTAIEIARIGERGPPVPNDLKEAYFSGLAKLSECVALHRNDTWDQSTLLCAMAAQSIAKGHPKIAEAILNLDDELITRLVELDFGD
ncbi:hypothetical protein [uncultured Litoreibacter sp.]|uniref:hypothetical protein n=1 Tax=uncultured Litoreibacter sp. TaxID=1392394 RepID=UPI0026329F1B|nr:hypothetical protein [uncultured Litoreibacter sp.]